ncbi:MAG TPA: S1 RNA-binding domain-containing protein [Polyangiaceae bacterium]|jgi:small subunit ribosomal protein S1
MSDDRNDSFAALFEQSTVKKARAVRIGERVEGTVILVGRDAVFIELDGKREAFIEAVELRAPDGTLSVQVGDVIGAQVVSVDNARGQIRLGKSLAATGDVASLERAREAGVAVEGKVTGVNKGGLEVDVAGHRAFCPTSQIDRRPGGDANELIGRTLPFLVTEIRDGGRNVVVSRRALLEREASAAAKKTIDALVPGVVVRGTVTAVRDFGAFVDLGGVEGLIPASEVTHDRSRSIGEALHAGDVVDVMVRELKDPPKPGAPPKITLSLKALATDPWENMSLRSGEVVQGTIARVTDFGAFVRLAASGIEGLLHASELGGKKDEALKALKPGEAIQVVVRSVDKTARRVGLAPAPEGSVAGAIVADTQQPPIGAVVHAKVDHIETYGIFVQIDGTRGRLGRGLIPAAELGVPRGTDLRKAFPEGSPVVAKVLETGDRKLRLSIKAAKDAEERAQFEEARSKGGAPKTLGTLGDLLKKRGH